MRAITLVVLTTGLTHAAFAADYDYGPLRGSHYADPVATPIVNWEGGYFGGFAGASRSEFAFGSLAQEAVADIMRMTALESEHNVSQLLKLKPAEGKGPSFGAFAGYNLQMDEIVFGFEFDYTRARLRGEGSDSIGRGVSTTNGYQNEIHLSGTARTALDDFGTLRARVGYTYGAFLPFVTAGVALGRAQVTSSVSVQTAGYHQASRDALLAAYQQDNTIPTTGVVPTYGYTAFNPITLARTLAQPDVVASATKEKYALGLAVGAGVDVQIAQNLFVRGEYQFVNFGEFNGHGVNVSTFRGGAGLKF